MMFEISGLPESIAIEALHQAQYKFPIKTKIVARAEMTGEQA
jgi:large subunit ribosomal protein L16